MVARNVIHRPRCACTPPQPICLPKVRWLKAERKASHAQGSHIPQKYSLDVAENVHLIPGSPCCLVRERCLWFKRGSLCSSRWNRAILGAPWWGYGRQCNPEPSDFQASTSSNTSRFQDKKPLKRAFVCITGYSTCWETPKRTSVPSLPIINNRDTFDCAEVTEMRVFYSVKFMSALNNEALVNSMMRLL